jgi:thiol-disulfide isomerase/thioredoxin
MAKRGHSETRSHRAGCGLMFHSDMKIEPRTVRAPEIGRLWFNSPPLTLRQLRGKVVLIDFWDYTCVNCIRTLPYLKAWHQRYRDRALVIIGVHTPEFTFAQYESNVERGIREFGLEYPIVSDSNYELWNAFANRAWPAKYLIDKEGYARYAHLGEGSYQETEQAIQELLLEASPGLHLPPLLEPLRAEDQPSAICYQPSPELYLGHRRGRIGNPDGFQEDRAADYSFAGEPEENVFYLVGRWSSTAEFIEAAASDTPQPNRIVLRYSAAAVNLVMASNRASSAEVLILQDGQPLSREQATADTEFRAGNGRQESLVVIRRPRMYALVDNRQFGEHTLELISSTPGLAAYAFTFTGCVSNSTERKEKP